MAGGVGREPRESMGEMFICLSQLQVSWTFPSSLPQKGAAMGKSILSESLEIATANIYCKFNYKKQLIILVNNFRVREDTLHGQLGVLQFKSILTLSKER